MVLVASGLVAMNLLTFMAFGFDKRQARLRGRRVSERTLLFMAALGGLVGAYAGRAQFRHKTRKQPFTTVLWSISVAEAVMVGWWLASGK